MSKLGLEPPKWSEIAPAEPVRSLPPHVKIEAVRTCPLDTTIALILEDPRYPAGKKSLMRYHWSKIATEPLTQTAGAPRQELKGCSSDKALTHADIRFVIRTRLLELASKRAKGGGLRIFCEPERRKHRKRIIRFTKTVNECGKIPREYSVPFAPTESLYRRVLAAPSASIFDIMGFYDSLELPPSARDAHIVTIGGVPYRLTTVPTGQRHSVGLAQLIALWLAECQEDVDVWIDNFRVNRRALDTDIEHAARVERIYERATSIGLKFNEPLAEARVAQTRYEFLGIAYDHAAKTIALGAKTLEKLTVSSGTAFGTEPTIRQVAAHYGVLFYCAAVLRIRLCEYFQALRSFRTISALPSHGASWDATAPPVAPGALSELAAWTELAKRNQPRLITEVAQGDPTHTVFTDASAWGWGSISVDMRTGSVDIKNGPWSEAIGQSTEAEPEAVYRALCAHVPVNATWRVHVYTDHQPIPHTAPRGYSRGFALNLLHRRVARWRSSFAFHYIPGPLNPADRASRNDLSGAVSQKQQALAFAAAQVGHRVGQRSCGETGWKESDASPPRDGGPTLAA